MREQRRPPARPLRSKLGANAAPRLRSESIRRSRPPPQPARLGARHCGRRTRGARRKGRPAVAGSAQSRKGACPEAGWPPAGWRVEARGGGTASTADMARVAGQQQPTPTPRERALDGSQRQGRGQVNCASLRFCFSGGSAGFDT